LLPSSEKVNRDKSDSLPSALALADANERITEWWSTAYLANQSLSKRFGDEVEAALPLVTDPMAYGQKIHPYRDINSLTYDASVTVLLCTASN